MPKKNITPINERSVLLVFDSAEDMNWWSTWYGESGEQYAEYHMSMTKSDTSATKNRTFVLESAVDRCPECKSSNMLDQADPQEHIQQRVDYFSKGKKLKKQYLCEDCSHNFNLEEEE